MTERIVFTKSQAQVDADIALLVEQGVDTSDAVVLVSTVGVEVPTGDISVAQVLARVKARPGVTGIRQTTIAALPGDRLFRGAWDDSNPEEIIGVKLADAKKIAHMMRRAKRDEVFNPHLEITSKVAQGIPLKAGESATAAAAEMDAYKTNVDDVAQVQIDAIVDNDAGTPIVVIDDSALRAVLATAGLI